MCAEIGGRSLADAQLPRYVLASVPRFNLLQRPDHLRFRKLVFRHASALSLIPGIRNHTRLCPELPLNASNGEESLKRDSEKLPVGLPQSVRKRPVLPVWSNRR